jgi:hypothetical protein
MRLTDLTKRYRIFHEDLRDHLPARGEGREMYQELRGDSDTRLYVYGEGKLAISCESSKKYRSLLRQIPGAKRQTACVLVFPVSSLEIAAERMRARRKRQPTEASRAAGRALAARYGFARKANHEKEK